MIEPEFPEPAFPSKASKRQLRKEQKDRHRPKVLEPRNEKQANLIKLLKKHAVVFAIGAAGSGKTYIPSAFAAQQLDSGEIEKIVMSRPTAAPSRHKLGYLPGTDELKTKPWMVPIMDAIGKVLTPQKIEQFKNAKAIETLPFEHMRGRTVSDAFFILDEAQNCTLEDLELVLTRIGEKTTLCICGDVDQDRDLGELSGLTTIVKMAMEMDVDAGVVIFDENDVVRSEAASKWVKAFKRRRQNHGLPASLI